MPGRFALDIETVSPSLDQYETPPDFGDPQHFELLAVALGHETPDGEREEAILFRERSGPDGELDLVERTCDWLSARTGAVYVTYGGERFDVPQLVGRSEAAAAARPGRAATAGRVARLLRDELDHVDVQPPVQEAFGEYTRLDEACAAVGIDAGATRWAAFDHCLDLDELRPSKYQGIEAVTNTDVPVLGERFLALADAGATGTVTFRALRELLEQYAREDVAHLFDLADARPFETAEPTD